LKERGRFLLGETVVPPCFSALLRVQTYHFCISAINKSVREDLGPQPEALKISSRMNILLISRLFDRVLIRSASALLYCRETKVRDFDEELLQAASAVFRL